MAACDEMMIQPFASDKGMENLLFRCISKRREMLSIFLLQNGVFYDCRDEYGLSPIHLAAEQGLIDLAAFLINLGVNLNEDHISPLHYAVRANQIEMTLFLLDHGAFVDQHCAKDGASPLFLAIATRNYQMCTILLNRGADINYRLTRSQKTPLHCAAEISDNEKIVQLLIDRGSEINAQDRHDKTPLYISAKMNNFKSYRRIKKYGGVKKVMPSSVQSRLETIFE